MSDTQIMIWFISMVVLVFGILAGGTLMAARSYNVPRRRKAHAEANPDATD